MLQSCLSAPSYLPRHDKEISQFVRSPALDLQVGHGAVLRRMDALEAAEASADGLGVSGGTALKKMQVGVGLCMEWHRFTNIC